MANGTTPFFLHHDKLVAVILCRFLSVPPKVSISELMGVLKGKTAIGIFKTYKNLRRKPYWGNHFWSRGYCVTTIGLDEEKIRRYVRYQEDKERLEEKERQEPGLF